jgi:hypothetical protein
MIPRNLRITTVAVCLLLGACAGDVASQDAARAAPSLEGLWSGAWGGGQRDGVVFQPVIAEMLIKGDHVEICGFRNLRRLTGTVRFDASTKRMHITPAAGPAGQPRPKAIEFTYEINAEQLTLTDTDKVPVSLSRRPVAQNPLANVRMEFLTATGINGTGDLLVTEYRVLQAGQAGATYYQPQERKLKTRQATILLAQEAGLKKVTVDEARALIRKATPVAVTYRPEQRQPPPRFSELLQDVGSLPPDSEAVQQTLSRLLRPGTLVFILPTSEGLPQP